MSAPAPRQRFSLQTKLTAIFIALLVTPTIAAWWIVTQISEATAGFDRNEADARIGALEGSLQAYAELIAAKKHVYNATINALGASLQGQSSLTADQQATAKATIPELYDLRIHPADTPAADDSSPPDRSPALPADLPPGRRLYEVTTALSPTLALTARFVVKDWQREVDQIRLAIDQTRSATRARGAMPRGYLIGFWLAVGTAVLIAAAIGALASRRVARRAEAVLATTRAVAQGDMNARTRLGGNDEFRELGDGIDTMLDAMQASQRQIEYLQRINTWQDVARRLAHEIKNPLTPIQLAIQQCVSAYKGDDAAFAKTLHTAREIVEEEIDSLRRLVDTFRTLGQLPRVQASPLPLSTVLDDLARVPEFKDALTLPTPPPAIWIAADRLMLRRLIANVIENGMQAGRGAGRPGKVALRVDLRPDVDRVEISIDDQGPGVTAAQRVAIFEPYYTTKKTGTGLGLSIAKAIAIDHGGDLMVAAATGSLGGARFVITVPVADEAAPRPANLLPRSGEGPPS